MSNPARQLEDDHWDDWPLCPRCGVPRQTVCPVCEVAGTDFPLAEYIPAAPLIDHASPAEPPAEQETAAESTLLLCRTCDEAFSPSFYRCCHRCGHDYGSGIEMEQVDTEELPRRVIVVMVLLGLVALGLIAYFSFVLR